MAADSSLDPLASLPHRAWGFREARLLQIAVKLGLFTALDGIQPCAAKALASAIACDEEMTERLLVGLGAMELVACDEQGWHNQPQAAHSLVAGRPHYQGEAIRLAIEEWDRYHDLERLVREGISSAEREALMERQQGSDHYLGALHSVASTGEAQRLARLLTMMAGRRTLLDVGGAPGSYAAALCQRYALLQATVLDRADAQATTEQVAAEANVAERCHYRAGDWRSENLGENEFDAVRLGYLLGGSESEAMALLVRAYEALRVGGLVIFQGFLLPSDLNDAGRAGLIHVLDSLLTLEQMQSLLLEAGFERVTVLHRDGRSADVLVGYKPSDSERDEVPAAVAELEMPAEAFFALSEEESPTLARQREMWQRVVKG